MRLARFPGFHEPFSDLVAVLHSALLIASISVLFLLHEIIVRVWSPGKPFLFQSLYFIITMDVEQRARSR